MKIGNLEVYGVIYKVTNKINGKIYIGQTVNRIELRYSAKGDTVIEKIYNYHKNCKNRNSYYNIKLYNSIKKNGTNNFDFDIIDYAFSEHELNIKECLYVSLFDSFRNGYNNTVGGDSILNKDFYNTSSKKVVCLNNKKVYNSLIGAERHTGIFNSNISKCCLGKSVYAGTVNGERLVWRYFDDYLNMTDNEIKSILSYAQSYSFINEDPDKYKHNYSAMRKVICLNTRTVYNSIGFAEADNKISNVSACCSGKTKSAGVDESGNKLIWMYYDEYITLTEEDIANRIIYCNTKKKRKKVKPKNTKKIICTTTGICYLSAVEAENHTGASRKHICSVCKGKRGYCGKLDDGTPLKWMYYDEYIKLSQIKNQIA